MWCPKYWSFSFLKTPFKIGYMTMWLINKKRFRRFAYAKRRKRKILCFRGTTLFHPNGMHLRCWHILTLWRELPFAATKKIHSNRSAVSSAKAPLCLAPTGNSLKVKNPRTIPHLCVYYWNIIAHDFDFVKCFWLKSFVSFNEDEYFKNLSKR